MGEVAGRGAATERCLCACYKTLFKHLHPYYQLSLHQPLHSTGEESRDSATWEDCVHSVSVN